MRTRTQLLFCFAVLAALAYPVRAQETEAKAEKTIKSPSPDGQFAFLVTLAPERRTVDLIEKKSEKVLLHVAEAEEEEASRFGWSVLWAPDSKRFALMTKTEHPFQEVSVYFRSGDSFRKIKLPMCLWGRIYIF
jgi:hypothetical protein